MIAFIEEHRVIHGVEPICRVLPIAPSTFYARTTVARDPDLASCKTRSNIGPQKRLHIAVVAE